MCILEGLYCTILPVKKVKKTETGSWTVGVLLADHLKVFDSLPHEVLVVELNAHGFHLKAFKSVNKLSVSDK